MLTDLGNENFIYIIFPEVSHTFFSNTCFMREFGFMLADSLGNEFVNREHSQRRARFLQNIRLALFPRLPRTA